MIYDTFCACYYLFILGYFIYNVYSITAEYAIDLAEKKEYPINLETFLVEKVGELIANNFQQLINWLNLNLNLLDEKLLKAEAKMIENNDFHPSIRLDRKMDINKFSKDSMKKAWHTIHQITNKA